MFRQKSPVTTRQQTRYPLELLARKADNFLNSTFVNLPTHQKMEPHQNELEIAIEDAEPRGIVDGDQVRVFNDRGEIFLRARVEGIRSGLRTGGIVQYSPAWSRSSRLGEAVAAAVSTSTC